MNHACVQADGRWLSSSAPARSLSLPDGVAVLDPPNALEGLAAAGVFVVADIFSQLACAVPKLDSGVLIAAFLFGHYRNMHCVAAVCVRSNVPAVTHLSAEDFAAFDGLLSLPTFAELPQMVCDF